MNKKRLTKVTQRVIVALVAVTLLFCAVWSGPAEASEYRASFIERNDDLNVNYKDYLNGSVVQKLPDTVKDDDVISVIITLDIVNLMDAYEKTDKTMSFRDYALLSEDAKEVETKVLNQRSDFLKLLDEKEITYKVTGLTYSTLLTHGGRGSGRRDHCIADRVDRHCYRDHSAEKKADQNVIPKDFGPRR